MPPWYTVQDFNKALEVVFAVNSDGEIKINGGHSFGRKLPGKTEVPERWNASIFKLALFLTWIDPSSWTLQGGRLTKRRLVDNVILEVAAYGEGLKKFRSCFPRNGEGVFINRLDGSRIEIPLDLDSLREEGWSHGSN